ncbi:MAG: transposase, partial [Chlamydiia bacterium]|nr:transposase [Chlamydiia bacterium]
YEVFAGNTGETKTLRTALENLSKKFNVVRATIVCDRGMLSKDNLEFAQSSTEMNYIIGEKLRKLPAKHHDLVFDKSSYTASGEVLIKDIEHPTRAGARLVLIYSESRAKKDKQDRERLLKKIQKKLKGKENEPKVFISNAGVKKYVLTKGGTATLNLEAIAKDEKWDGFFGIVTDHKTLSSANILSQYRGLWQVEAAFRLTKHNLSTRPIFHWTPHRIKAHISICFQALVLERHLEVRLKKSGQPLTTQNIHDALSKCQKVILQDRRSFRLYEVDSNKPPEAKQIYEAVGLTWRKPTRELPRTKGLVVSSVGSVRPQAMGIAPL